MRLLHTADWHVGKHLRGRSRDQETIAALDQVVEQAKDAAVDAVLIAGDVYEHRTVSAEADLIVFEALARLRDTGATIVVVPGNHDSWQRLEALGKLLTPLGILAVPRVLRPTEGGVVELPSRDGSETALIACVPFVPERRFGDAAALFDDRASAYTAYDEGMGAVMSGMARAFRLAVEAGRRAYLSGLGPERETGEASSPLTGFLEKLHTSQADPAVTQP